MRPVRGGQHHFTMRAHRRGLAEVDDRRLQETEPAVMMVVVVPAKERLTERAAIFDRSEAVRKLRAVFERSELGFGKRIVVGHVWPAVRFGDAEIGQEQRDGLAAHRATAVRVDRQLAWLNVVLRAGLGDQSLGEDGALARREHPPDDVATEDVEDHIEIEVGPLGWPEELGDVPAPDFIGARGQQLGRGVVAPPHLIAALFDFVRRLEDPVHRARRAKIGALIEQRGMDLRRRLIDEPRVEEIQHALPFDGIERSRRRRSWAGDRHRATPSIQRGARDAQDPTRGRGADRRGHLLDGPHQASSSLGMGFSGICRSAATFLRNSFHHWGSGHQGEPQALRAALQVVDHALPVAIFIGGHAGVDVGHAKAEGVVEQNRELASGGGHRLGFARAGREASVKGAERRLRPPNIDRRDAQHGGRAIRRPAGL
jgi:hypothetical protein